MQLWLGREPGTDRARHGCPPVPAPAAAGLAVHEPGKTGAVGGCQGTRAERSLWGLWVCIGVVSGQGPTLGAGELVLRVV